MNKSPIHFNDAEKQASETAKTTEAVNSMHDTLRSVEQNTQPKDVQKVSLEGVSLVTIKGDKGDAPSQEELLSLIQPLITNNAITASGNAATVPVTSKVNTVTNDSAATLTITMTTAGAVNRQSCVVCILDFSAVAQTITWVNTENSTVTAPTTSNVSTTLPLTVGFMYNSSTSKWRCVASA